jgi:putative endonuclease
LGRRGELHAQVLYRKNGYRIIAVNEFNRQGRQMGEVDFIATDKTNIVFVEVKTRKAAAGKFGSPADSINTYKQKKIIKAVKLFLLRHPEYNALVPRIDACFVIMDMFDNAPKSVTILSNAVEDTF